MEVGNIVINSVIGTISNILQKQVKYHLPNYMESNLYHVLGLDQVPDDHIIIVAHTHFVAINRAINGKILLVFEASSLQSLMDLILASDSI